IGILTTAEKQSKLRPEHKNLARDTMCQLNKPGADFSEIYGVKAMTDVTGFGLLGHLSEICQGSGLQAVIHTDSVPVLPGVYDYIAQGCCPGGTQRNFDSYGHLIGEMTDVQRKLLCDPQTSGGLLLAVDPAAREEVEAVARKYGLTLSPVGELTEPDASRALIEVTA
ncbi:MAG: selenide, water dikinase SelD, partial [Morganella morganii]